MCQDGLYFETRRMEAPIRETGSGSWFLHKANMSELEVGTCDPCLRMV